MPAVVVELELLEIEIENLLDSLKRCNFSYFYSKIAICSNLKKNWLKNVRRHPRQPPNTLADFPAVFVHISHWYLSWNTAGGGDCI